jgi:hypothetical protein
VTSPLIALASGTKRYEDLLTCDDADVPDKIARLSKDDLRRIAYVKVCDDRRHTSLCGQRR